MSEVSYHGGRLFRLRVGADRPGHLMVNIWISSAFLRLRRSSQLPRSHLSSFE